MKRRRFFAAGVGLVFALVGTLWLRSQTDPGAREIRRVQQRLHELAATTCFKESDPPFARLAYAGRVAGFFGPTTEFDITLGNRSPQGSFTHTELQEGAAGLRAGYRGLSVDFIDIAVELAPGNTNATAHLTSKIYFVGDPDYFVQEFRIGLGKATNVWRVHRIETVRTMEP